MSYPPPPPPGSGPPGAPPPSEPPPGRPGSWPPVGARAETVAHDPRALGEEPRTTSPIPLWAGALVTVLFVLPTVVFFIIGAVMMPTEAGQAPSMSDAELTFALGFSIVLQLGLFAVAVVPLLAKGWFGRTLWGSTRPATWAIGLAVGVGATIAAYILMTGIALVFTPEDPVEQQIMQDALRGGAPAVLAIIAGVLLAPVTEEIVFRGALYRSMRGRIGVWPAAIGSALIFTFIHVEVVTSQPLALPGLFALGIVFAIALQKTGSLIVPILGHAVFNATSFSLALLADRFEQLAVVPLVPPGFG